MTPEEIAAANKVTLHLLLCDFLALGTSCHYVDESGLLIRVSLQEVQNPTQEPANDD